MFTGRVAGTVVSTLKDENLIAVKLLVVELIENGKPKGYEVAADGTRQAGPGDFVYLIGKKEATLPFKEVKMIPVDLAVIGFIDKYNEIL